MSEIIVCDKCAGEYCYFDGVNNVCPQCDHQWSVTQGQIKESVVRDGNGVELFDGDSVTVIKDLKVKGSSIVVKRGTKVKNIRLAADPDHVDCKVEGSSLVLKTCYLKK